MTPEPMRDLMRRAGEKARLLPAPDCYLWSAVWWHLHARESANPTEPFGYARNQLRLARDMAARPGHYRFKPTGRTDWTHSGLAAA